MEVRHATSSADSIPLSRFSQARTRFAVLSTERSKSLRHKASAAGSAL